MAVYVVVDVVIDVVVDVGVGSKVAVVVGLDQELEEGLIGEGAWDLAEVHLSLVPAQGLTMGTSDQRP